MHAGEAILFYFLLENVITWYIIYRPKAALRIRNYRQEQFSDIVNLITWFFCFMGFIRDSYVCYTITNSRIDIIYGISTQAVMSFEATALVLCSILAKLQSLRLLGFSGQTFISRKNSHAYNDVPSYAEHLMSFSSFALFVAVFLWYPSVYAFMTIGLYSVLAIASYHLQENFPQISERWIEEYRSANKSV